jgi:hypothetical protein
MNRSPCQAKSAGGGRGWRRGIRQPVGGRVWRPMDSSVALPNPCVCFGGQQNAVDRKAAGEVVRRMLTLYAKLLHTLVALDRLARRFVEEHEPALSVGPEGR